MRKKFLASAAVLALLMNVPHVHAEDDDIIIFGGEFEDETSAPKEPAKPAPTKELPPPPKPADESAERAEKPARVEVAPRTPAAPASEHTTTRRPGKQNKIIDDEKFTKQLIEEPATKDEPKNRDENIARVEVAPRTPAAPASEHTTARRPGKRQKITDADIPAKQLVEEPKDPPLEESLPEIDRPFPSTKISDDRNRNSKPVEPTVPAEEPAQIEPIVPVDEPTPAEIPQNSPALIDEQTPERQPAIHESTTIRQPRTPSTQQQNLRTLKPRFVKLAADDTYTYYLDKNSVQWKRLPYSASEYMADIWIRMVERKPKELDSDMAAYGEDNFNAEISFAREQGYQYAPEDLQVLRSQAYVLEHYYLRPKTKQIQFLCELEVFGRPQNTINERAYDYRNWENLVPGSVESAIYNATIKIIGKSASNERGHMTFFDMLDEYARIALN